MAQSESEQQQSLLESPKAPGAVLAIGDIAWKAIAEISNLDFVLSMREEKLAMIFEFLLKYGWIAILLYGIVNAWRRPKKGDIHQTYRELVWYVGLLAFMGGVLLTTWAAGGIPNVFTQWGQSQGTCTGTVNTSRLTGYADKYKLGMVCLLQDPTIDKFEDGRIAVSAPFTITGDSTDIVVPFNGTPLGEAKVNGPTVTVLHVAILFPKNEDFKTIKHLSDVKNYGGIVLFPRPE